MGLSLRRLAPGRSAPASPDGAPRIALISQAAYHVDELAPLRDELARDYDATLYLAQAQPGPLRRFRSANERFERSAKRAQRLGFTLGETTEGEQLSGLAGLVVMTDWETTRPTILQAQAGGAVAFGRVEGAQDFTDADTGRTRQPYQTVDVVLCQGANDHAALDGRERYVVGNTRLQSILESPPNATATGPVVINSNFSYNVLTDQQAPWLAEAIHACERAGLPFVVSRHPADRNKVARRLLTSEPVEDLLTSTRALVSRFSSLGYEALARGVPLLYHNPHGEHLGSFAAAADGGYLLSGDATALERHLTGLRDAPLSSTAVRAGAASLLARQVDVTNIAPHQRAAEVIASRLAKL